MVGDIIIVTENGDDTSTNENEVSKNLTNFQLSNEDSKSLTSKDGHNEAANNPSVEVNLKPEEDTAVAEVVLVGDGTNTTAEASESSAEDKELTTGESQLSDVKTVDEADRDENTMHSTSGHEADEDDKPATEVVVEVQSSETECTETEIDRESSKDKDKTLGVESLSLIHI